MVACPRNQCARYLIAGAFVLHGMRFPISAPAAARAEDSRVQRAAATCRGVGFSQHPGTQSGQYRL